MQHGGDDGPRPRGRYNRIDRTLRLSSRVTAGALLGFSLVADAVNPENAETDLQTIDQIAQRSILDSIMAGMEVHKGDVLYNMVSVFTQENFLFVTTVSYTHLTLPTMRLV